MAIYCRWRGGGGLVSNMRILVACEFSGTVRDAFRLNGQDAVSCDLLPSDAGEPHYQCDVFDMLEGRWDLIIAHPPCTALAVSGNATYGEGQPKYSERLKAVAWTKKLWDACIEASDRVCFENPVGVLPRMAAMPRPQYVQPWMFGHTEQKKTGLFLHNLPKLLETDNVHDDMMLLPKNKRERLLYLPPSQDRWKIRSTTYTGLARAMADQWGIM